MKKQFEIDEIVFAAMGVAKDTGEAVVREGKVKAIEYLRERGENGRLKVRMYTIDGTGNFPPEAVFETRLEAFNYCFAKHDQWVAEQSKKETNS